jgi:hypothetical protein
LKPKRGFQCPLLSIHPSETIKPIIILLALGVNFNIFLSWLLIRGFLIIEEKPKGLFHIVKDKSGLTHLLGKFLYKYCEFKNKSGIFTFKDLYKKFAPVAAVKYALVSASKPTVYM